MLTLRAAAGLLGAAGPDALVGIAAVCGFRNPPLALEADSREALGLATICAGSAAPGVRVVRWPGSLRALLVDLQSGPGQPSIREIVSHLASRLARRTPQLVWLCVAGTRGTVGAGQPLALATWSSDRQSPRTAALIMDRDAIVDSDAETLCALAASVGPDDALTHEHRLTVAASAVATPIVF